LDTCLIFEKILFYCSYQAASEEKGVTVKPGTKTKQEKQRNVLILA